MNPPQFVWIDETDLNSKIKSALNNLHLSETANDYLEGVVPTILATTEGEDKQFNVAKVLNNVSEMLWFLEDIQKQLFPLGGDIPIKEKKQTTSSVIDNYVFMKYLLWKLNQAGKLDAKHKEVIEIEMGQCWVNMLFSDQQEALRRTEKMEIK